MDKAPPPLPWYQRRRSDPGHLPADAAGLGTAFGLDLSLRDGADPGAPAGSGRDATPGLGWAQRVLARRQR